MKRRTTTIRTSPQQSLNGRLAAYVASAAGISSSLASDAGAVVVGNNTVQPFGINQEVSIDFNSDGQTDFQIDHDRVNVSGADLDYLQIDKNDINGESNPLAFDPLSGGKAATFMDGASPRNDANSAFYVIDPNVTGSYPAALAPGTPIGPVLSEFDWQESNNFQNSGKWIRANRLMDEDATQIDQVLGGRPASGVQVPFNGPNFDGSNGAVQYLGLKMELNDSGLTNYGWVGIRIDNEADATGAVVGYGYETLPNVPILAGALIPEPGTIVLASVGAIAVIGSALRKKLRRG